MKKIEHYEEAYKLKDEGKLIGLFQMSNETYHRSPAISKSVIPYLLKSVSHYLQYKKERREQSPGMKLGSLVHLLVLEPHLFESQYAISKNFDRRTTIGKQEAAAFEEANKGKEIVDREIYDNAKGMVAKIMEKENARKLLRGIYETSAFWIDKESGVLCKCRPDIIADQCGLITDLKTCQDASPSEFIKSVANYTYHIQEAFYIDGLRMAVEQSNAAPGFTIPDRFAFIAVESKPPFAVALYELPSHFVETGREKYKRALMIYKEYLETKKETAYSDDIQALDPKPWMYV